MEPFLFSFLLIFQPISHHCSCQYFKSVWFGDLISNFRLASYKLGQVHTSIFKKLISCCPYNKGTNILMSQRLYSSKCKSQAHSPSNCSLQHCSSHSHWASLSHLELLGGFRGLQKVRRRKSNFRIFPPLPLSPSLPQLPNLNFILKREDLQTGTYLGGSVRKSQKHRI